MLMPEVIAMFRRERLPANPARIRAAIRAGNVPRPARNVLGLFVFSEADVEGVRRYLKNPPRCGRRPKARVAAGAAS